MNSVLEYLEVSAERFPDKTAAADINDKITFKELRQAALRLAAVPLLMERKNRAIGVMTGRKISSIIYFFAALCSGNFYVPLDPDMPAAKLNMIVENAEIDVILADRGDERAADITREMNFAGLQDAEGCGQAEMPDFESFDPDTPLFMIYTSGSTGVPKGVLKSHKAVLSFIEAYVRRFGFDENEVIGNQTPFFFDASAKDIYLMLKTGASMEILPTEYFAMPPSLIRHMNERGVTFISWVPSALSVVVQLNTFSAVLPETLKRVFFVGEVMPMKHLNKWRSALPEITYVNLYGSTEVAGISCCYEADRIFENDETLPMGKPLDNCKVYLMDGDSAVTEPGHTGELFIVSDALALCYYKDEKKTDESFVMKDFGDGVLRRAYRSGDLAAFDGEGNLVFASRADYQIKHMGHRIELGEIETAAGALEGVDRCACLYNSEKGRIVLFVKPAEGAELSGKDIKAALSEKLSSYMVPQRVNILEEMPYNANNKIDRQKLKELL